MVRLYAAVLAALFLTLTGGAAAAAGAIAYSAVDEHYGWSAGYGSSSRAAAEAMDACRSGGGQDCRVVLDCPVGWGSIAYADDAATGVAMICSITTATAARMFALELCIVVSNTMCWTASTWDDEANELPESSNEPFDLTYYAQEILTYLGFFDGNVDGENGPKTRDAVRAFQSSIGWEADGELDFELFWVMMDMNGGQQTLQRSWAPAIEEMKAALGEFIFTEAAAPFPVSSFTVEIARRADNWRRQAMAAQLVVQGHPCTIPALMADPVPADGSGGWYVSCAEGDYTIALTNPPIVAEGFGEISVDGTEVSIIPPGATPQPTQQPSATPARGGGKLGH